MSNRVNLLLAGNLKRTSRLFLATLVAATLGAAAAPALARTSFDIMLNFGPPAVVYEPVPPARVGFVWQPGYWNWVGARHVWVRGYWVPARRGFYYHPYRWVRADGGWYLRRGWWGRDSDHDGIPNGRDRYPHNPYRR